MSLLLTPRTKPAPWALGLRARCPLPLCEDHGVRPACRAASDDGDCFSTEDSTERARPRRALWLDVRELRMSGGNAQRASWYRRGAQAGWARSSWNSRRLC